jgi:hypothetical protein
MKIKKLNEMESELAKCYFGGTWYDFVLVPGVYDTLIEFLTVSKLLKFAQDEVDLTDPMKRSIEDYLTDNDEGEPLVSYFLSDMNLYYSDDVPVEFTCGQKRDWKKCKITIPVRDDHSFDH